MKLSLIAVLLFLLPACATQPPPPPPSPTVSSPANPNPTPTSFRTDATDCERQAALAGAGGKSAAFDSCMRARGRTPGR
jgi:hypothetical protein